MMSVGKPLASQVNPFRKDGKVERSTKSSADGINSGQEKRPQSDPRKFYLEGYGLPHGLRYRRHVTAKLKVESDKIEYAQIELGLNTRAIQLARLPRVDAEGNDPLVTLFVGMNLDEEKEGNPATPSPAKASNVAARKGKGLKVTWKPDEELVEVLVILPKEEPVAGQCEKQKTKKLIQEDENGHAPPTKTDAEGWKGRRSVKKESRPARKTLLITPRTTNVRTGSRVYINFVWDYTRLSICSVEDEEKFVLLQKEIAAYIAKAPGIIGELEQGDLVLARYRGGEDYYRASVVRIDGTSVHLVFVDYGDDEIVPLDSLREMSDRIGNHPIYGLEWRNAGLPRRYKKGFRIPKLDKIEAARIHIARQHFDYWKGTLRLDDGTMWHDIVLSELNGGG